VNFTDPWGLEILGLSTEQWSLVSSSLDTAVSGLGGTIHSLKSGSNKDVEFKKWFGSTSDENKNKMVNVYSKIQNDLAGRSATDFKYDTDTNAYAYVYKPNKVISAIKSFFGIESKQTIYLGSQFFYAPAEGVDTQSGVLVHESSHLTSDTMDYVYGTEKATRLASDDPDKAMNNADNVEYYYESLKNK